MKKQIYSVFAVSGVLLFMLSIFNSCLQEEAYPKATVETSQVSTITEATATLVGIVIEDGGSEITTRGFCWSTSPIPTIENDTSVAATSTPDFSSSIKGLNPGTTYYVRAYAVNKGGVAYGHNLIFTTKTLSLTTTPISVLLLTATSAISGGSIISDGDSSLLTVTAHGVCWNTFPSPTIENSKTTDGVGGGRFTSKLDSLTAFTTYYARAYATNGNGTIYGNEITFTTQSGVVDLTTSAASAITAYSAKSGGSISSDGGASVTERGICWNTSPNPTTENSKTINGSGTSTFIANITGLTLSTTYYVRSYGINSVGTSYGNEVSFTTQNGVIGLTTNTVTSISTSSAICSGTISSNGGATISMSGVCWSTSENPTIADNKTTNGSTSGTFTSSISGLTSNTTYYVRAWATNNVGTFYGNQVSFSTLTNSGTVTDIEGNVYKYITIGTQSWMIENLRTTKLNNGTNIPLVTVDSDWQDLTTPAHCFTFYDASSKKANGALYNWYTVNTGKLAPTGWHVPTDSEWTILENYLIANGYNYDGTTTGNKIAKALAAKTGWVTSTITGTIGRDLSKNNTSGFSGTPVGLRGSDGGVGISDGNGFWWTSTPISTNSAIFRELCSYFESINRSTNLRTSGYSVRCVKDY